MISTKMMNVVRESTIAEVQSISPQGEPERPLTLRSADALTLMVVVISAVIFLLFVKAVFDTLSGNTGSQRRGGHTHGVTGGPVGGGGGAGGGGGGAGGGGGGGDAGGGGGGDGGGGL